MISQWFSKLLFRSTTKFWCWINANITLHISARMCLSFLGNSSIYIQPPCIYVHSTDPKLVKNDNKMWNKTQTHLCIVQLKLSHKKQKVHIIHSNVSNRSTHILSTYAICTNFWRNYESFSDNTNSPTVFLCIMTFHS